MARRFNLDVDMDFALEVYDFANRFDTLFDLGLDFGATLNSNIALPAVFSNSYAAFAPSDIITPLSDKEDSPVDGPQPPGQPLYAGGFGASFELSSLLAINGGDGSTGFVINGIDAVDYSGESVSSAGDINGDGFDDFIIGAYRASPNGAESGEAYVVFGRDNSATPFGPSLDLSALDGVNGFAINGISSGDHTGRSVSSAGDINGDGYDDFIIGASLASSNGDYSGSTYVIFGRDTATTPFAASLELSTLNGTNGFVLIGSNMADTSGVSVSDAGDVNGDGFADILIGANGADPNGNSRAGEIYVVFGRDDSVMPFAASLDLSALSGVDGFVINGIDEGDIAGFSVSNAGDINGDGFDDVLIGAFFADANNNSAAGESYVVFGRDTPFAASLDLSSLNGLNGFIINGVDPDDTSGRNISSAGDINGDGFDDIIIGATSADPNGNSQAGESYVIFGRDDSITPFAASLDLSALNGVNGFVLNGIGDGDFSSRGLSSAGDINGDGFDDLLIGAYGAGLNNKGETYVVYGRDDSVIAFPAVFELSIIDGANGFVIKGIDDGDVSGRAVSSAGDINGDGFDDIIIGARAADPNNNSRAGESYVIYGQANSEFELSSLLAVNGGDGSAGSVINGIDANDNFGDSVSSAGDINGDGFDDLVIGASGAGPYAPYGAAGEAYVVFGSETGFGADFDVSSLLAVNGGDGSAGFVMPGLATYDSVGRSVSAAGDINGDGFDDVIIGAVAASPAGETYVIFGSDAGFAASLDLSLLDGTDGFVINGIDVLDTSGWVSSAGDVNGDGFDDIMIGANRADPNGVDRAGETYVIFGNDAGYPASFDLSSLLAANGGDGSAGFVVNGIDAYDNSGRSVSSAGDVNGDGFDDIIIGMNFSTPFNAETGESYIVFGSDTGFGASLDLSTLNGTNGFVLNGVDSADKSGFSVSSAGDFNGDGFDDILIGANSASPNGVDRAGESYLVFGSGAGFPASFDLTSLNGINGFVLNGIDAEDKSGFSVSSAGDINGDGFDDIIIGARQADPNGNSSGESYIVFGSDEIMAPSFDLSTLNGMNGFVVNGVEASDSSGTDVSSAGDINGDGFDDLIIGAIGADNDGFSNAGASYVIYGSAELGRIVEILSVSADTYTASNTGEVVFGLAGNDVITGGTASDVLSGDEGDDILNGAAGNDRLEGGAGNDTLNGGDGNDTAMYNGVLSEYDIVNNGDGTYSVTDNVNGNGSDTLLNIESVQIGTELIDLATILFAVTGTPGNDNLIGTIDDDVIDGLGGNDILDGLAGDDEINGGDGADRLIGGLGADALNGGAGFDSADYRGAASGVRFNVETGGTVGEAAGDTFSGIERYYLSNFNDIITGSDANEFFYGEDGNDQINGGGGIDRIYGGDGNDVQRGQDGNDTLYGSAGADQLNGGAGFDIANYSNATGSVIVRLSATGVAGDAAGDTYFGIEAVYGSDFNDALNGNASANELRGGDGNDTLEGLGGNDRLYGGEGGDVLDGGTGIDIAVYTTASSAVGVNLGGVGTLGEADGDFYDSIEWVWGSAFDDIITGDEANNRLEGRDGNDTLNGEAGNDRLIGGDGNDTINGGDGVDTIFGQDGDDILFGGADNDFFFGGAGADSHDGGSGIDTVSYLASSSGVTVDMQLGGMGGDAAGDTYINVERIFGTSFDDSLRGSTGDDVLLGNGGADFLDGGMGGNDTLIGGAGIDSFGFSATDGGSDVISGFFASNEVIYIYDTFDGENGPTDFSGLLAIAADAGANTIFTFSNGSTLTLTGLNIADLSAANFDFDEMLPAGEPLDDFDSFAADIVDVFDMDALI